MTAPGRCSHGANHAQDFPDGTYECSRCGQRVTPRNPGAKRIRHGTRPGFDKHYRVRKGAWGWPVEAGTCGCREAMTVWTREYGRRDGPRAKTAERGRARQRAGQRLKDMYPADFAKIYAEELSFIRDGGRQVITGLYAELARVLGPSIEAHLERHVQAGTATLAEREQYREVQRVRGRIAEAEERAAACREPGADS